MPIPGGGTTGDTLDLLTLDEGRTALNDKTGQADATRLAQLITAISRRIDDICGPVVMRDITEEATVNGSQAILRVYPVDSITSLTEYAGTTAQALSAENFPASTTAYDYALLNGGASGLVERRSGGLPVAFGGTVGTGRVLATYIAGRYPTTAAVDPKFKEAAAAILRRVWAREAGRWTIGADPYGDTEVSGFYRAIDPMIEEFLGSEVQVRVG